MSAVTPDSNFIQQESLQFNQPVSEGAGSAIGALANYLRQVIPPVGSIVHSMLTLAQFQAQNAAISGVTWVLADGGSCAGSEYQAVSGNSTVPDLRGVFLRGKNNGRSGATGNPDGDLALGTYQADQFGTHNHSYNDPGHLHGFSPNAIVFRPNNYASGSDLSAYDASGSTPETTGSTGTGITFVSNGGNETRARNVTVNIFIRIN